MPFSRAAIRLGDDRVLRHVDETTRQIAGVGRLERGVGEALAGAVGRVEVLENVEAFLEVRDDRRLDDLARRLGHQAAHRRELLHLGRRTAGARVAHHVDRVDRLVAAVLVLLHGRDAGHHLLGELVGALRPGVDDLVVLLALGDQAVLVLLLVILGERAGGVDDLPLVLRHDHVVLAEGDARLEGVREAERHDAIAEDHRLLLTAAAIDGVDHPGDFLLGHQPVADVEGHVRVLRQRGREDDAAGRGVIDLGVGLAVLADAGPAVFDLRMQRHDLLVQRVFELAEVAEDLALARLAVGDDREVIQAEHDVLRRHDDRQAVGRVQDVVGRHHQHARFQLRLERQRDVHGHLVAVEVGVEGGADQRVQLDRLAFDQHGLEGLDAEAVQRRRAVEQHRMLADDLVQDIPDLRLLLLDQLLGLLDRGRVALGVEARIDERLEQLERHLLRQPALVQLHLRADHDDRTAGIVDALAEQVLAEAALLALQHVGERLQRTLVGAGDDAAATAVVEQRIDRFLQHPLLVADDDVGRAQLDQPLQAVVAVDDAAIQVVQVRGREAAAIERHERTQIRRDHRDDGHDHPLGLVARELERLDDLEALHQLLGLQLRRRRRDLMLEIGVDLVEVERAQHLADRLRADHGGEGVRAILFLAAHILFFGEQLAILERRQAGLDHHIGLEVQDALEILERHVHQQADARGQRLQEPDMRDRGGELDMAHALAPDPGERHFDAALLADDALELHALVLAAQALVVLDRPEDARAEQAVPLRLERPVVDGLRLLDLAIGPGQDFFRAGDRDADRIERLLHRLLPEEIHDLLLHRLSPAAGGGLWNRPARPSCDRPAA